MASSFKYTFVKSASFPVWHISSSLSFSADGKLLAIGKDTSPSSVSFLNISDGSSAGKVENYFSGLFLRTEADKIVLAKDGPRNELFIRDSSGLTWSKKGMTWQAAVDSSNQADTFFAIEVPNLFMANSNSWSSYGALSGSPTAIACAPDGNSLVIGYNDGTLQYLNYPISVSGQLQLEPSQFSTTGFQTEISACVWSHDGRWIAAGDIRGIVCLWDATNTKSIMYLQVVQPPQTLGRISRLIFDPDNTVLIILNGSQLLVWDIGQKEYISGHGLPSSAQSIAMDYARKRVAIAIGNDVLVYDMKVRGSESSRRGSGGSSDGADHSGSGGSSGGGDSSHRPDGDKPSIPVPSDLKDMDITSKVSKSQTEPFQGLYYKIYRGVFDADFFEHVVAIKCLRTGFDPRSSIQERKAFESSLCQELKTWHSLKHDNLVRLIGVTTAAEFLPEFGQFPAIVTSWMIKGLLTEYFKSNNKFDRLSLTKGVANGVMFLHSKNLVHGDIQAASILIDERGNPRLADTGLLKILDASPLMQDGGSASAYRWMAPELFNDSKRTSASDVFAFTMTSWEIYAGDVPFAGLREFQVANKILQDEKPVRPSNASDALWELWGNGWDKDYSQRPAMSQYVKRLNAMA